MGAILGLLNVRCRHRNSARKGVPRIRTSSIVGAWRLEFLVSATIRSPIKSQRLGRQTARVQSQSEKLTGIIGRTAGWIMSRQNAPMNRAAIIQLQAKPNDKALEIGCEPGSAIKLLADRISEGTIQ
jgi:hypothetical protein